MTGTITKSVPLAVYRKWDGFGASDLKAFRTGPPALVPWRRENQQPETDATRLGSAAHCAILEPAAFASRYVAKPEKMSFATTVGKEWKAAVPDGVIILTHDEWEQIDQIREAFAQKSVALAALATAAGIEDSLSWSDPDTSLPLKARPDWYDGDAVYDLKISRWGGTRSLEYRIAAEGWASQVAHYWAGLNECGIPATKARLVVVNPEPPQSFRVSCVELKENALGMLHLENEATIRAIAACVKAGEFPGEVDDWRKIDLPSSALTPTVDWGDDSDEFTPLTAKRR